MGGLVKIGIATILLLTACGPSWTAADTKGAANTTKLAVQLELACAPDAACPPPVVRALERAQYCSGAATLARHGQPYPDAGIRCEAP